MNISDDAIRAAVSMIRVGMSRVRMDEVRHRNDLRMALADSALVRAGVPEACQRLIDNDEALIAEMQAAIDGLKESP